MKILRAVVLILAVAGAGAFWWFHYHVSHEAAANQLVLYGNVDIRQVQLAFNDSERIASLLVQEGDRVEKGQLVATLQTSRLEAVVKSREAEAAAQAQVVARLEAGSRPEEIREARANVDGAQANLENAKLTFARVSRLVTKDLESRQRRDDARAALDVAQARLAAAHEAYRLIVIGPRKEDIAAAKATLEADRANLALAQRELADTKLDAPSDGVIQNRLLERGDMASPQQPVFTLALNKPVWVRTYVPETDLGKIRPGMKAEVTTDSFPGKTYQGWIGYISPTAEFTPKTVETPEVRTRLVYQVRVFVRQPEDQLRLGMPAVVTIPLDESTHKAASPGVQE